LHAFILKCYRYNKAIEAKKERASKSSQSFGAKGIRHGTTPQQVDVEMCSDVM
jgi:hypothetical protein